MSISLGGVVVKHERRLRLAFSNSLASGAFVPGLYVITSLDGRATPPVVVATFVITGAPGNVELALGGDLVQGAAYQISAIGVPATDLTVTGSDAVAPFQLPFTPGVPNSEPKVDDGEKLLYGQDIVWNGKDFLETANGDLFVVAGANNVRLAIERRLLSEGLLWDPGYGAKPRQYVDSAAGAVGNLKANLIQQAQADDRVKRVTVDLVLGDTESTFEVNVDLIGGHRPETISVGIQI